MLFEDDEGRLLMSEEVDDLSPWEIADRKLHVYDDIDDRKLTMFRTLNIYEE